MLKRIFLKKTILICATLFAIGLLYLIPKEKVYNIKSTSKIEYTNNFKQTVYLLNNTNYLERIKVNTKNKEINAKAKELLEILIDGTGSFKGVIPKHTKINSIKYENNLIKVDFSEELLSINKDMEEKMIEAIVYTLTSIKEIEKVIIYVNGEILTKLPSSKITLPSTLDRSYGINKEYELDNYKNIDHATIYYSSSDGYYVPVTKYYNGEKNKIKVIIDELASSYIYDSNLMSYLNSNTKLLATEQELDTLYLVFNEYIFNDINTKNILEEVAYSISLSIKDSCNIKNVVYIVDDKEIYKTTMKTLENY